MAMDDRLRTHLRNIDRYQNLLKTELTEIELQYLERRLLEERSAVAMLYFMSPPEGVSGSIGTEPQAYHPPLSQKSLG
jgi:hypothetical protein